MPFRSISVRLAGFVAGLLLSLATFAAVTLPTVTFQYTPTTIAQGAVWANAARSHMAQSLQHLPAEKRQDPAFFIGNMVPTCIADDKAAAAVDSRISMNGSCAFMVVPSFPDTI